MTTACHALCIDLALFRTFPFRAQNYTKDSLSIRQVVGPVDTRLDAQVLKQALKQAVSHVVSSSSPVRRLRLRLHPVIRSVAVNSAKGTPKTATEFGRLKSAPLKFNDEKKYTTKINTLPPPFKYNTQPCRYHINITHCNQPSIRPPVVRTTEQASQPASAIHIHSSSLVGHAKLR